MRIEPDVKLDFDDVLIVPKRSTLTSRNEVDINRKFVFKHGGWYEGVPILACNMDTIGTFKMNLELAKYNMGTCLHKYYSVEELTDHYKKMSDNTYFKTFYTMGITDEDYIKFRRFVEKNNAEVANGFKVSIDVANGYQENFVKFIAKIREYFNKNNFSHATIMAGTVVTPEITEALLLAGADIARVGIGSGSACTTRLLTGVGYPQLSALVECADAAHGLNGHICSDGGCKVPGDIVKAFGAGSDFVSLGGMLASHDECEGELILKDTDEKFIEGYGVVGHNEVTDDVKKYQPERILMKFYGMSSETAMEKYSGGVAGYRASEGKTVLIPYKGPVENTIQEILGGLRSAMTYIGAKKLKEISKRTSFVMVNRQKNDVFGRD